MGENFRAGTVRQEAQVTMHRWSAREVDYLIANANDGAQAVADALGRTVASVQMKAHRLGISLHPRWMCPRCARWTYRPL